MTVSIPDLPPSTKRQRVPTPAEIAEAERMAQWRKDLSHRTMRWAGSRLPPEGVRFVVINGVEGIRGEIEVRYRCKPTKRGAVLAEIVGRVTVGATPVTDFMIQIGRDRWHRAHRGTGGVFKLRGGAPIPKPDLTIVLGAVASGDLGEDPTFAEYNVVRDVLRETIRYTAKVTTLGGDCAAAAAWAVEQCDGHPLIPWLRENVPEVREAFEARAYLSHFDGQKAA